MKIEETIFLNNSWKWSSFLQYLINRLGRYECSPYDIPSEYLYRESNFGKKKNNQVVSLYTWAARHHRINLARAVCINSPNYEVLNFLIIPNTVYNVPFLGLDFVTLPKTHLLVLDFQPSLKIEKQFDKNLLDKVVRLRNNSLSQIPIAEKFSNDLSKFFSPGLIWSKLPRKESSEIIISTQLLSTFKSYLDLYLEILFKSNEVDLELEKEIINGQNDYLHFRKEKDPARPMLKNLFGDEFCESLIENILFTTK